MSTKQPELLIIEETNFHNMWYRGIRSNLKFGFKSNGALENIILVRLTKDAITQIENREVHPQFPNGSKFIDAYCEEYTYEYLENYLSLPEIKKFVYLYFERFARYPTSDGSYFDQIQALHDNLRANPYSRQLQMITWIPYIDSISKEPPCLQRIQVRQIASNLVDLHYDFRSWDICGASPTNIIAITYMMNKYILKDDYKINSINALGRSAHVYLNDLTSAESVKSIPIIR